MRTIFGTTILALLAFTSQALNEFTVDCQLLTGVAKVVCLADAFKATLTKEQLELVQIKYDKGNAMRWSNFPQAFARPSRVGLSLGSLNETQRKAFTELMSSVLSGQNNNEGLDELKGSLAADDFFGKKTGKTDALGSDHYVVVFLGLPTTKDLWELMFGGHHFAFANTYDNGKLIGATPSFRGVEPNEAINIDGHTYNPMLDETQVFSEIITSLPNQLKSNAKLNGPVKDVVLGPGDDGNFPATKEGIRVSELPKQQQLKILQGISLYVHDLDDANADAIMQKYTSELGDTFLSYSGSGTMSQSGDYIRIDGPSVWIEFSAQPSRDFPGTTHPHPHSVWRDHKTDYGGN